MLHFVVRDIDLKNKMKTLNNKFDELQIKWKVFIYLSTFCFSLLLLMWLLQVVFLDKIYKNTRVSQMVQAGEKIANIVITGRAESKIDEIAQDTEACVMIVGNNGRTIYTVDMLRESVLFNLSYLDIVNIISAAKENDGQLKAVYSKTSPFQPDMLITDPAYEFQDDVPQSMVYCRQILKNNQELGYIILNIRLSPVSATVTAIESCLKFITIIMLLFSIVVANIISRKVAKPIEQLSVQVKHLATGDYETVFDASGYGEINQLTQAMNHTASELGKVETLRRDFIANVSHDLRTPLTLIGGYAEVMRDIPGENNAENAQYIIDETRRLSSFVTDLLDMSRIQSGAVPMEKNQYNLTESFEKTVSNLQRLIKQDGYTINFEHPGNIIVSADSVRISQCFYNILVNAVNYTGADKQIFVKLISGDGMAKVSVTDTGNGVDEKDIPFVWQRYYKSDENHRRSVTGTGIGLSIVQSVIKAHNGNYGVYNTDDKGACFWFEVPIR